MSTLTHKRTALTVTVTVLLAALAWWAVRPASDAAPASAAPRDQAGSIRFEGLAGGALKLPLRSFGIGGAAPTDLSGGGGGTGKYVADPAVLTLAATPDAPLLFQAMATGRHLPTATVTLYRPGTRDRAQMWTFTEVIITKVQQTGTGAATPRLTVTLGYARSGITSYTANGEVAQTVCLAASAGSC